MKVNLVETKVLEAEPVKNVRIAVKDIVHGIRQSLADGWQPGADVPMIIMTSLNALSKAVSTFDQVDDAFKDELAASLRSSGLLAADVAEAFVNKSFSKRASGILSSEAPEVVKPVKKTKKAASAKK